MQAVGWWYRGSADFAKRGALSFDRPCAWDINCGWCEEWAEKARQEYGGTVVWLDEILDVDPEDVSHAVLYLNGRYYDSQHPEGVIDPRDLDIMRGVTREEYLARKV